MSGGSHDYICYKIEEELGEQMEDNEMNDLINDLFKVTHDLEWWKSGDIEESDYRDTVQNFKDKWFGGHVSAQQKHENRVQRYIIDELKILTDKIERM